MRCDNCNGLIKEKTDNVPFRSVVLGTVLVPTISFNQCESCGERSFDRVASEKITSYVKEKEDEEIRKLPVSDFISANDAAKILSMTKQAFSKNKRINVGFIFSVIIDNRKYYNTKSLSLFQKNGRDGRFFIGPKETKSEPLVRYIIATSTNSPSLYGADFVTGNFNLRYAQA